MKLFLKQIKPLNRGKTGKAWFSLYAWYTVGQLKSIKVGGFLMLLCFSGDDPPPAVTTTTVAPTAAPAN